MIKLLVSSQVYAQNIVRIEGTTGAELSNLKWAVAGNMNGGSPNIFSELKWQKLSGINYSILASLKTKKVVYFFRSSFSPDLNGIVEDTDYGGDNRTNVRYKEVFPSSGGRIFKAETGVKFDVIRVNSLPLLKIRTGIRYRSQRLYLDQENKTVQSNYNSRWGSVFFGIEKTVSLSNHLKMYFSADADLSDYEGYGNWKLRTELAHPKSFVHHAIGYGINARFKTNLQISPMMALTASIDGWCADSFKGKDILYFNDGSSIYTQLNGVSSLALNASMGLSLTF